MARAKIINEYLQYIEDEGPEDRFQFITKSDRFFRARDMKLLGTGRFSRVFDIGRNKVFKISINDSCWNMYVKFARQHKSDHLPEVYEYIRPIKIPIIKAMKVAITILEKLLPIGSRESKSVDTGRREYHSNLGLLWEYYEDAFGVRQAETLIELLYEIDEESRKKSCSLDLHSGNLMKRRDGTVVINDPIYERGALK